MTLRTMHLPLPAEDGGGLSDCSHAEVERLRLVCFCGLPLGR
jgi:hypothetical protein